MVSKEVLVAGGAITGIQASIDLANMGYEVHLVESQPTIGGRMAQLDKTFPTNDCSICILAPKMIECYQHPNVNCMTYSEVIGLEGGVGDFKVKIRKKPRYVDVEKCTGCEECVEKCPTKVGNEFDLGLGERKAIYLPFPQAVPKKVIIDPDNCVYMKTGKCRLCEETCQAGAIDLDQKEEIIELDVGAIVVCTGLDFYDMTKIPEYGYGKIPNVVTAMELERLMCASGPTMGRLQRPSDSREPTRIAFIQCVGSRDAKHNVHCSSVCCMHSVKEAILASEHNPDTQSYVFYTDLRAAGKGFQDYLKRAEKECGVEYIRSRPARIAENGGGDPIVRYEDTQERHLKSLEVDLVVLAQALVASSGTRALADIFKLGKDRFGFLDIPDPLMRPMDTTVPGIFACGFCQTPSDIPESIAQASGAAARVAETLEVMT